MNKLLLAGAFLLVVLAATEAAQAADIPRAPVYKAPVVAPVYDWTGFYIGGTWGYSVGRDPSAPTFAGPGFGPPFDQVTIAPGGWVGGGEVGFNWQTGKLLLGIEGDWQWTGQKDSFCLNCFPLGRSIGQELPWFATARGRIGYVVGPALFYATGGVVFGDVRSTLSCCTNAQAPVSVTDHKTGWVFGGGIEAAIVGNWTAKIEYLYLDLGSTDDTIVLPAFAPATMTATSNVRDHIFRAGLNYRIGGTSASAADNPIAMHVKAPLARLSHDWSGFYVGVNVGYSAGRDPIIQSFAGDTNFDQFTFAPAGWLGGAQVGLNWQTGNLVLGLEGDWQWTGQRDPGLCRDCPLDPASVNQVIEQKLPWFATARGRAGYAAGPVLFYATGGVAFTQLDTNFSQTALPDTQTAAFSNTKTGWALGGGIEAALVGNWTVKAEYLYLDFGSISVSMPASPIFGIVTLTSDVRDHVFRLGLNYKVGTSPAAVVAKY